MVDLSIVMLVYQRVIGPSLCEISLASRNWAVYFFHCSTDWERKFFHAECMLNLAAWASCTSFLARPCCVTAAWRSLVSTNDRICLSFSLSSLFSGCSVELPSANQSWQWKIHHIYRWFSQEPLRLYVWFSWIFHCHVWLPRVAKTFWNHHCSRDGGLRISVPAR